MTLLYKLIELYETFLFKISLVKVSVLNKAMVKHYANFTPTTRCKVHSDYGDFDFTFLQAFDFKHPWKKNLKLYVIEVDVPEGLTLLYKNDIIRDKAVLMLRLSYFKFKEDRMAQLLSDVYLTRLIKQRKEDRVG